MPVQENVVSFFLDDTDDDDTMDAADKADINAWKASVSTVPQRALRSIAEWSGEEPVLTLGKSACGVWLLMAGVFVAALVVLTCRKFSAKHIQGRDDDLECFVV